MRAPALLILVLAGCGAERPPPAPPATTVPPPAATAAGAEHTIFPPPRTVIGTATMLPDRTLVVSSPHQIDRVAPSDPQYAAWLSHLGGMKPGEEKPAPAWPDEFDAARVEAVVRAYLTRKGIDPNGCRGDILGTDHDKNVTAAVACKNAGLSLHVQHGSYAVVEVDLTKP